MRHLFLSAALSIGCGPAGTEPATAPSTPSAEPSAMRASSARLAYCTDDDRQDGPAVARMLASLPGVAEVRHTPPLSLPRSHGDHYDSCEDAQAKAEAGRADLFVIVRHGYVPTNTHDGKNALSWLNLLIVPIFFSPWVSTEIEGYVSVRVVDVATGRLVVSFVERAPAGKPMVTIWADGTDAVAEKQWPSLLARARATLATRLAGVL